MSTLLKLMKKVALVLLLTSGIGLYANAQAPTITFASSGYPMGTPCVGVAYGNGVYVSVTWQGQVFTSTDAVTWRQSTTLPTGTDGGGNQLYFNQGSSLAFGGSNNLFVLSGPPNKIYTSSDGVTWTPRTTGVSTSVTLTNVACLNGTFFVGNYSSSGTTFCLTSTDGINWATNTVNTGDAYTFLNFTYGAGTYVITARNLSGTSAAIAFTSSTGASGSWAKHDFSATVNYSYLNDIKFCNNTFYGFTTGPVATSANGGSWSVLSTSVTNPNSTTSTLSTPNQVFQGFYNAGTYYFYGSGGSYYGTTVQSNSQYVVFTSTNGTNFTMQTQTAPITNQGVGLLNGKYFVWGNEGFSVSTDGINYSYTAGNFSGLAYNGTTYVAVGSVDNGNIFSSPDFATWTARTPAANDALYDNVVNDGSRFLTAGSYGSIQSSSNGTSWSNVFTSTNSYGWLAYGGGEYVVAGADNSGNPFIQASSNATSWSTVNTTNFYCSKIRYLNGAFYAVGSYYDVNSNQFGIVLTSTNGTSWTTVTPSISQQVNFYDDMMYDGSKYVLTGMEWLDNTLSSTQFFSISSATPATASSWGSFATISSPPGGTYIGLSNNGFAYSNGHYVGSANDFNTGNLYFLYSSNGTSWSALSATGTSTLGDVIVDGSNFRFVGSGDTKVTASFGSSAPTGLSYTGSPFTYTAGVAIAALTPTVTGTVTGYTIMPSLPNGLSINATSGVIMGTPLVTSAQQTYTVKASNASGNTTTTISIQVICNPLFTATFTSTPANGEVCNGGFAVTVVKGVNGIAPYNFSLNGGTAVQLPSYHIQNLTAGSYTETVTDATGCAASNGTLALTISQPASKVTATAQNAAANCTAASSTITVNATGGWGNYTYNINGGAYQASNSFTAPSAGTYTVLAKDQNGCVSSATTIKTGPLAATFAAVTTQACYGAGVSATVTASAGTAPYQYSLNGGSYQAAPGFTLTANTNPYSVTVKDNAGCTVTTNSVTITQPALAFGVNLSSTPATCRGGADGTITAQGTGSYGGYSYSLNSGAYQTSGMFTGLKLETDFVKVKDANGCLSANTEIFVSQSLTPCGPVANPGGKLVEPLALTVKAYPNPSQAEFVLTLEGGDETHTVELLVRDMFGNTVYHAAGTVSDTYRFGSTFAGGIYVAQVLNGNKAQTVKLVKGN